MPDQWSVWSSPGTAPADFLNNDNTAGAVQVPEIQEIDLLARALLYLVDNPTERERMGRAGEIMAEDYSWAKIAQRTEKVYQELLT